MDELRPFQAPDLSSLQAGSACLAKHEDGLWHSARIVGEAALLLQPCACPHTPGSQPARPPIPHRWSGFVCRCRQRLLHSPL